MIEVCNKSDFIISLSIKDKDGVTIPYTQIDWEVSYYTDPVFPYKIFCKDGVLSSNSEIVDDKVISRVNGFDFTFPGVVYKKVVVSFNDSSFPDGKANICFNEEKVTNFKILSNEC